MFLFFHFLHFNVPGNKCPKQKWCVLFFTCIRLVVHVLVCAHVITCIKWIKLDKMLVCLTPEHETKNYFHLETAKGETFSKKKNLYFAFVDVEKVFD